MSPDPSPTFRFTGPTNIELPARETFSLDSTALERARQKRLAGVAPHLGRIFNEQRTPNPNMRLLMRLLPGEYWVKQTDGRLFTLARYDVDTAYEFVPDPGQMERFFAELNAFLATLQFQAVIENTAPDSNEVWIIAIPLGKAR